MLSARLYLVRHGQSAYNADGLLQGQADPPLSEAGRRRGASAGRGAAAVRERAAPATCGARARPRRCSATRTRARSALARDRRRRLGGPSADRVPVRDRAGLARRPAGRARRRDLGRPRGAGRRRRRRTRGHVADRLPRRRRPGRAVARHRRRSAPRRGPRERQRDGDFRRIRSAVYGWTVRVSVLTRSQVSASSTLGRRWSPYAALILGPLQGGSNGNRPAGTMGPPCRPVTPKPRAPGSRSTASSRAARDPLVHRCAVSAGGGAVSRRNCSIAAITAAASSGEAVLPCSSRRGRRFIAPSLSRSRACPPAPPSTGLWPSSSCSARRSPSPTRPVSPRPRRRSAPRLRAASCSSSAAPVRITGFAVTPPRARRAAAAATAARSRSSLS